MLLTLLADSEASTHALADPQHVVAIGSTADGAPLRSSRRAGLVDPSPSQIAFVHQHGADVSVQPSMRNAAVLTAFRWIGKAAEDAQAVHGRTSLTHVRRWRLARDVLK